MAAVLTALTEVTLTHTTIINRNHTLTAAQVREVHAHVSTALSESQSLLSQAEELSEGVREVSMRLSELERLLEAAKDRAVETSVRAVEAQNESMRAESLGSLINVSKI